MARKRIEGNTVMFWFGFLFFLIGMLFSMVPINSVINSDGFPVEKPLLSIVYCLLGSFCIYGGLALLLQAGLGSFWNEQIDDLEKESDKPDMTNK